MDKRMGISNVLRYLGKRILLMDKGIGINNVLRYLGTEGTSRVQGDGYKQYITVPRY